MKSTFFKTPSSPLPAKHSAQHSSFKIMWCTGLQCDLQSTPVTQYYTPRMFGLGRLLYVVVLSINGIAVLSEDRFLNRIGWGSLSVQPSNQFQNQYGMLAASNDTGVKSRLIALISAIRTLLRLPLIVVNILIILYELILG